MSQYFEVWGSWVWVNREWLFSGVGLSVTLVAAGISWKVLTILGRACLFVSIWAAEGLFRLRDRLRNRHETVPARFREEDVDPGRGVLPGGAETPKLLTPSRHEIAVVNRARADHDMQVMGWTTGKGPYGYLQGGRRPKSDDDWIMGLEGRGRVAGRDATSRYVSVSGRMLGGSVVARLFFFAAALNLLWVAIRWIW